MTICFRGRRTGHRVPAGLTHKQRKFGGTMLVAGALLVSSFLVYHLGGRGEMASAISTVMNVLGTLTGAVAVLLRWKGPWREEV